MSENSDMAGKVELDVKRGRISLSDSSRKRREDLKRKSIRRTRMTTIRTSLVKSGFQ